MRFLFGFISATLFIAIMIIACWLYFDFPISTNDEEQQNTPVETSTESLEKDNTQEQQAPATIPSQEQKHNGITPPNMKEKTPTEVQESIQRKSEIQALQENDKQQDWKKEYDDINEGTDENPYVMIDGKQYDI